MKNDFLNTLEANDLRIREDLEIYCEKDKQGITVTKSADLLELLELIWKIRKKAYKNL